MNKFDLTAEHGGDFPVPKQVRNKKVSQDLKKLIMKNNQ